MVENVEKRGLSLLLPQNKENCLDILKESKRQEKPAAQLNFLFRCSAEKLETLAFEQIVVSKTELIGLDFVLISIFVKDYFCFRKETTFEINESTFMKKIATYSGDINCAHDHLENIVTAKQRRDVDWFAL